MPQAPGLISAGEDGPADGERGGALRHDTPADEPSRRSGHLSMSPLIEPIRRSDAKRESRSDAARPGKAVVSPSAAVGRPPRLG